MVDIPKVGKFDFQKIISDVKSMISPVQIPEASKDDPAGYCISELSKIVKELADASTAQANAIAKLTSTLGALSQAMNNVSKVEVAPVAPTAPVVPEDKKD